MAMVVMFVIMAMVVIIAMIVIVRAVLTVRVAVPRVLAVLGMIVAVALGGTGLGGGHYAAIQHSSVWMCSSVSQWSAWSA